MEKGITFVGLDAHKVVDQRGDAVAGRSSAVEWECANEKASVRRMVRKVKREAPGEVRFCYEAGPCGYALQRWIREAGAECVVVAPSLIPRKPGERIKTDRRDARKLAELDRAGLLTEVHPPTEEDEAARDLCRAREDAHEDLVRSRHRLSKLLLRRGWQWMEGKRAWGQGHRLWLRSLRFEHRRGPARSRRLPPCHRAGRSTARGSRPADRDRQPGATLRRGGGRPALLPRHRHPHRHELGGGAARLHALRLRRAASWRFWAWFPANTPREAREHRGEITKAGNGHVRRLLIEAAWHYRHRPG